MLFCHLNICKVNYIYYYDLYYLSKAIRYEEVYL
jgi:hypothetical protein